MKRILTIILTAVILLPFNSLAQQGVHGPKVVSAANTIVNEYTAITAFIPAGSTSITVAASTLNANGRFATNLQPGDLVMLYQAQGAIMRDISISPNPDTAWGRIDPGNYFSTGLYEFRQVVSVPNATTIVIDCGTTNAYIPNAGTARKPMVVRVPRYTTLTINAGGVLTCDDWNGTIGGVLAVEVQGNTVVNAGGIIDANGKGFRGGSLVGDNATTFGSNTNATTNNADGAEKGESLCGYQAEYDPFGGRYSRAAPANGGGGGSGHNGGGGGGANAPNSTGVCTYNGLGIPDQTGVGWTTAWNLEPPINTITLRTSTNSAGGGRGGYTFSGSNQNATVTGPSNAAWGGDSRRQDGTGLGGRPLDYSVVAAQGYSRLFLGGGGGAGDQNNSGGGVGGDGGGLIYLMVYGTLSGSGTIQSNGLNGANATGGTGIITGIDGAGGGGGGGTIVLNSVGGVANTLTVNTNGGNGGTQVVNLPFSSNEGEGPGGGGGGGYIAVSSGTPTRNSNGGNNGTTNSGGLTEFTPNGATKGCPGTNNASISNFYITTTNITICTGNSVTLTATVIGTLPPGAVINWYTASVGGSPIATGTTYNTGPLSSTTTYWVGTCAGWWRVPVTVTVGPAPVVSASASPATICSGSSSTLTASGATTYSWMPGSLSGTSVVVSPAATTTYTVTGTTGPGCSSTAQVTVTVNPTPTVSATASPTTICAGNSSTLTGSGAASYTWNPGAIPGNPVSVTPASTTTYTVTGTTSGCSSTAQVTVTVNPSPTVTATASAPTICSGNSSTLTGGGASSYVWNPGAIPGSSISVTPASTTTYTVTGTGGNGCTSTAQVTVTVNPTPTVTATASSPSICPGSSTNLTGSGATSYVWNPGAIPGNPVSVSPAATTTYTVTGTSAGCSSTAQVTVTVLPTPTVTATAAPTTVCAGNSTNLTGGGAVSYVWNPGAIPGSPVTVTPPATTTYTVTGTGGNGCTSTAQVTVTVNPSPTVTATASSPTICSGNSTNLTGSGAVSYVWNPGAIPGSPISVTPAATTTYTVTGTGGNGCTSTAQVTVTVNPTPTVTATASAPTICAGSSTNLTGSGATSYVWNPGAIPGNPVSVSPAATTTYTVTGTSGTCNSTAQVTVTVNPTPTVTATASSPTICAGNSSTLTGGGAASYVWNPGAIPGSSISVTPASTTTYTVTGTAGNGCTSTAQVTVTVNPSPTVTATASSPTICSGNSSTLTGGGAASYVWNPGAIPGSPISVTPAATTTYTVTGTGGNGCTSTAQVTVTVNPTPTVTATASSPTICAGNSSTLTGNGATSYVWNPGAIPGNSVSVSPASTTTYTVTGTSGTCNSTAQVTVTVNPLPTPTATATPATICNGQSSSLSATGGTTYTWNGGALVNANGTPQTVSPSSTITYTVDVTDVAGCSASTQVTLTVNPLPVPDAGIDQTICSGNTASLLASGGGTYAWNGGALVNASGAAQTVSPGATTSYTVTVTNGFGCQQNDTMTVNVNITPSTSAGPDMTICTLDTAQLNATGAGTFSWNPATGLNNPNISNPQANPASTTTYTVTLTAGNGCSVNDTITVNVNNRPTAIASNDTTICSGSTISITSSGGGTYAWNGGALVNSPGATQSVTVSSATAYVVTVTAANGCTDDDTVNVAVNALPTTNAGPDVSICPNSSIQLNATGAANYSWSPSAGLSATNIPNPVANPVTTTTYVVTGTNASGCTRNDTIVVTIANNLTVFAGPDITMCSGDTVLLSTSGGVNYTWSPALSLQTPNASSTNAFPSVTTTYTVNVTDANSCTGADMITVFVNGPVNLSSSGSGTICIGQSTSINATPSNGIAPYTYNWSNSLSGPGPQTVSPVATTTYTVSVTDSLGCTSAPQSITVTVNPALTLASIPDTNLCSGNSVTLNANASGGDGNYTYTWMPGTLSGASQTLSPGTTTTYSVIVADGCTTPQDTVLMTVTVNPNPSAAISSTTNVSCFGGSNGSATANASSGTAPYTYAWTPSGGSAAIASGLQAGSYSVTVTDSLGCTNTQSVSITQPTQIIGAASTSPEHCINADGSASVSASGGNPGYTYLWSTSSTNDSITNVAAGTYTVTITDNTGCSIIDTVIVGNTGGANANAGPSVTITNGQSTTLTGSGGVSYTWSPSTDLSCSNCPNPVATPTVTTIYTLTVTDANGCTGTDTMTVYVDVACGEVFVPNAFSPNNDGSNDTLYVRGNCIKYMDFQVYNRWGEKVFQTGNPANGWDGTWRGHECEAAIFTYVLRVTLKDDTLIDKQGTITLVK